MASGGRYSLEGKDQMTPEGLKELQEALAVTNRIQNRHALLIEDHDRWLESQQKWMERTEAWMERHQAWAEKIETWAERQQDWAERIDEWAQRQQDWAERAQVLIDQIAAAQLASQEGLQRLEATVQAFIESMRRGGNGAG